MIAFTRRGPTEHIVVAIGVAKRGSRPASRTAYVSFTELPTTWFRGMPKAPSVRDGSGGLSQAAFEVSL